MRCFCAKNLLLLIQIKDYAGYEKKKIIKIKCVKKLKKITICLTSGLAKAKKFCHRKDLTGEGIKRQNLFNISPFPICPLVEMQNYTSEKTKYYKAEKGTNSKSKDVYVF